MGDRGERGFGRLGEGADDVAWDEWWCRGRESSWVGGGGGRMGFESSGNGLERVGQEGRET